MFASFMSRLEIFVFGVGHRFIRSKWPRNWGKRFGMREGDGTWIEWKWYDLISWRGENVIDVYVLAVEADYSIAARLVQRIAAAVGLLTVLEKIYIFLFVRKLYFHLIQSFWLYEFRAIGSRGCVCEWVSFFLGFFYLLLDVLRLRLWLRLFLFVNRCGIGTRCRTSSILLWDLCVIVA